VALERREVPAIMTFENHEAAFISPELDLFHTPGNFLSPDH
jgi:hypothetical protein